MGKISNIEWTDATWNPWQGCHKVSAGCENCYMYRDKKRFGQDPEKVIRSSDKTFYSPLKWKEPKRIMVCSWSDFFIEEADEWRLEAFKIMSQRKQHTFIILTKRTERMSHCFSMAYKDGMRLRLNNVWFLASVENQETANKRITELLRLREYAPWPVLGISAEPLLGAIDARYISITEMIERDEKQKQGIDWIICGGESGPNARPIHPDWVRSLRDQAVADGVPFFFKQWGEYAPCSHFEGLVKPGVVISIDGQPEGMMTRVGKKKAGHLLDGKVWDQMPEVI